MPLTVLPPARPGPSDRDSVQELLLSLEGALECLVRAAEQHRALAGRGALPADLQSRMDDALGRAAAMRADVRDRLMRMMPGTAT